MNPVAAANSVDRELAAIVGDANVAPPSAEVEIDGVAPAAVVAPGSPEEVAAILRMANERELVVPPAGGFTK